jgi:hypothetical protein
MEEFMMYLVIAVVAFMILLIAFNSDFTFTDFGKDDGQGKYMPPDRTVEFKDFTVYYTASEEKVGGISGEVSNGVFGGEDKTTGFQAKNPGEVTEALLSLNVSKSNYYGKLIVLVNDKEVYADYPPIGEKMISFDRSVLKENNVIRVLAETSGWRIWAPTVYDFDMKVVLNYFGRKAMSFVFDVNEKEMERMDRARIAAFGNRTGLGNLDIMINGVKVYSGIMTAYRDFATSLLREGNNTVSFSTEANTRYDISSAQVILFFE